ncbi:hypothetical protein [Allosphingosinicella sp.]|uniref:hypothetical protein n=1 Tax=Allosphingosinicella sp. TaxID=2823234 RepID=UPI00378456B3
MRKMLLLLTCLAAACGKGGEMPSNETGAAAPTPAPPAAPVQTATLTGLYESGSTPPSQLCIIEQGRSARFGLVIRRNGRPGCSGAGTATRNGPTLRLAMTGDSPCAIEARIEGGRVTFPSGMPPGCSYYCAPGIVAGGTSFEKTGGTTQDALHARDAVGDRLCT